MDMTAIIERGRQYLDKVEGWIYKKVFASVDIPENLELIWDVAIIRKRYLTAFGIMIVRILYRIESVIITAFKGK